MSHNGVFYALLNLVFTIYGTAGRALNTYAGPYIAYGKVFYMCDPGYPTTYNWHIRTSHFNPVRPKDLQRLTGNVTMKDSFGDDAWVRAFLDSRSNNQWKENAFVFYYRNKACSKGKAAIPDAYRVLFQREACPIPKNFSNEFVNEPVAWIFPNVPVMPYGSWRFRYTLGKSNVTRACWVIECSTIPKQ